MYSLTLMLDPEIKEGAEGSAKTLLNYLPSWADEDITYDIGFARDGEVAVTFSSENQWLLGALWVYYVEWHANYTEEADAPRIEVTS